MKGSCSTHGKDANTCEILVVKLRHRWEGNIKMDLKWGVENVDWIHLVEVESSGIFL
jgi:hypothetical protein